MAAEKIETIWVKSNDPDHAGDPNHVAFWEVHGAHPENVAKVMGGGAPYLVAETPRVKKALKADQLQKATETEVKALKQGEAEPAPE